MTALETRTSDVSRVLRRTRMTILASSVLTWRSRLRASVAAYALGSLVVALPSYAQTVAPASAVGPGTVTQVTASLRQIDAGTHRVQS